MRSRCLTARPGVRERRGARAAVVSRLALGVVLFVAASCHRAPAPEYETAGVASTVVGAADAAAAPLAPPPRLRAVVEALTPAFHGCPDRVWPGLAGAWRAARILFTSRKAGFAWLFSGGEGRPVDVAALGEEWFALFHNGRLDGARTLGVAVDVMDRLNELDHTPGRPDFAITTAAHEAFHYFGQRAWRIGATERRAWFPEPWRPELLRSALVESVREEVRAPGGPALAHAAAYLRELRAELGDETAAAQALAVLEGTAEYATLITLALADVGCDATNAALHTAAVARIDALVQGKPPYRDGYDVGALAGVLLRARGDAWTREVERGTSPVELLLADVRALPRPPRAELVADVRRLVETRNAKRAPQFDALKARLASRDQIRVVVSGAWVAGSYRSEEHVLLSDVPGASTAYLGVHARFTAADATTVHATGHVIVEVLSNPCGIDAAWVLTVPASAVTETAGRFSATTDTVAFERLPATRVVERHHTWLCAAAAKAR